MFNATWKRTLKSLVMTAITGASACSLQSAHAQATGGLADVDLADVGGIQLAPGETIIESTDSQSGLPVPMFNAQTNQPITGSAAMPHQHHAHAAGGSGYAAPGDYHSNCFCGCEPGCYVGVETLFMRRQGNSGVTLTPKFGLGEFDHEWGGRFTIGRTLDCTDGYEASFTGMFEWDLLAQQATNPAAVGIANTLLTAGPGIGPGFLDVFTNADFQRQTYEAQYNSFELNKTYTGWDVVRLLYGFRYIDYSEDYQYSVLDSAGPPNGATAGFLRSDVENNLIGGQIGIDMGYPLGERLWSMIRARGGVFANFSDSVYQVATNANGGTSIVNNSDEGSDLSGILEFGTSFRYRIGRSLAVSAGYEFWYLANIATAPDQLATIVAPTNGLAINVSDDIFFHGAVFGIEFNY